MSDEIKHGETVEEIPEQATLRGQETQAIVADLVDMQQSVAGRVTAQEVHVVQGGIVAAEAGTIDVERGGTLLAQGAVVSMTQGSAAVVIAERAELQDSFVGFLAAQEVGGEAKILVDLRAAVVFGVVAGLASGLLGLLMGRKRD